MKRNKVRLAIILSVLAIFLVSFFMKLEIEPPADYKVVENPINEEVDPLDLKNQDKDETGHDHDSAEVGKAIDKGDEDGSCPMAETKEEDRELIKKEGDNQSQIKKPKDKSEPRKEQPGEQKGDAKKTSGEETGKPKTSDKGSTTAEASKTSTENNTKDESAKGNESKLPSGDRSKEEKPKDQPAPPERPEEPKAPLEKAKEYCTIEIRCDTILNNMDNLRKGLESYVPANGVILSKTKVEIVEGDSVFDILKRITRSKRIQMEFRNDALYSGAYIEGINHLYEFDCGNESGWMYKVNGWFPNYGCSKYMVKDGDNIVWCYTCDLGRDVGDQYYD